MFCQFDGHRLLGQYLIRGSDNGTELATCDGMRRQAHDGLEASVVCSLMLQHLLKSRRRRRSPLAGWAPYRADICSVEEDVDVAKLAYTQGVLWY